MIMSGKWILGLRTATEQEEAKAFAKDAYKAGELAAENRDIPTLAYQMGYLACISDLALYEGAAQLARDAGALYNRLDDLRNELMGA
jgi:hypothetical protein